MSFNTISKELNCTKPFNFATKDEFEDARNQLRELIKNISPKTLSTSSQYCGQRWTQVMNSMWDENGGLLKNFRKMK